MQKKLVQSSLALAAAAALSLGSAFVAGPAAADAPQTLNVQSENQVQEALSNVGGVNAYGVRGGTLNVGVTNPDSPEAKELADEFDNVNVVKAAKNIEPQAKNDIVGGAGYLVKTASGGGACSTGFSGWDDDGDPVILTAGHCSKNINEKSGKIVGDSTVDQTEQPSTAPAAGGEGFVQSGNGVIGEWGYHKYGGTQLKGSDSTKWPQPKAGDIDFAVINVDEGKYGVKSGITDWTTAKNNDLAEATSDITTVGSHSNGEISKSGRTTGLTTGTVFKDYNKKFDFQNVGGYWVHGFAVLSPIAKPFSQPGDSGGGVFQGDKAVGVISGGGPYDASNEFGWVADLDYSIEKSGVGFNLEQPEAPNVKAPKVSNQTIEPKGEVKGKAKAGLDVEVSWKSSEGSTAKGAGNETVVADENGVFKLEGPETEGDYDFSAVAVDEFDGEEIRSKTANFDVTVEKKKEETATPKVDVSEPVKPGAKITGTTDPGAEVTIDAEAKKSGSQIASQVDPGTPETVTADDSGQFEFSAPSQEGEYVLTVTAEAEGKESASTTVDVTVQADDSDENGNENGSADGSDDNGASDGNDDNGDENGAAEGADSQASGDSDGSKDGETPAPAERKLTVEPKEIAASDFVKEDKGVQITAEGFEEGEKVTLKVVDGPEGVKDYEMTQTANAEGVVGFSIYGTSASNPEAYLGKYDVQVTGANDTEDEEALTGSFQVVADEDGNGGGNDGDDNGNDDGNGDGGGSDLPRTGAELTGLAAGAGLLLVGGAAVVLTMRRKKNN